LLIKDASSKPHHQQFTNINQIQTAAAAAAMDNNRPTTAPQPTGYSIDVRLFLAIMTTTMAIAFSAGVLFGPTDPALVGPVLSRMGIRIDLPAPLSESSSRSNADYPLPQLHSMAGAGMNQDGRLPSGGGGGTSKKAKVELDPQGNIFQDEDGNLILKQHRRLPTDHVATLGYKIKETHVNIDQPVLEGTGDAIPSSLRDISYDSSSSSPFNNNLRDQTTPSGQHLLIDIKNVEAAFLNSESRLATAMQDAVLAAGLTMLSYHCHSLHPAGVSCVGVLLESHISFHTWPEEGVITLDLFTTSEKPLLPALPTIEALFGIPRYIDGVKQEPVTVWSHELRGFRTEDERKRHYLDDESDLSNWVTSPLEVVYKKQLVGRITGKGQRVDVWDAREREDMPSYKDGLLGGWGKDDPRWLSNEHASPQRMLFVNGALMVSMFVYILVCALRMSWCLFEILT
jgi:S-adenosylmethionine decarboxylase proenzyme